jgi:hypothetical protein
MPLTVTPGGPTDDSFVTLADASTLLANEYDTAAWDAEPDPVKERLLRLATRQLTQLVTWDGSKTVLDPSVQRLPFPRDGLSYHDNGVSIANNVIPDWLELATAITALRLHGVQTQIVGSGQTQQLESLQVSTGSINMTFDTTNSPSFGSPAAVTELPEEVCRLLEPYGRIKGWHSPRVVRR